MAPPLSPVVRLNSTLGFKPATTVTFAVTVTSAAFGPEEQEEATVEVAIMPPAYAGVTVLTGRVISMRFPGPAVVQVGVADEDQLTSNPDYPSTEASLRRSYLLPIASRHRSSFCSESIVFVPANQAIPVERG
jgi:hypothetical protein